MDKPLNKFGGWLKFFWVINLISLLIYFFAFIGKFALLHQNTSQSTIHFILAQFDYAQSAVFIFCILKYLKKQEPATPQKIVYFLFASGLVTLAIMVFKVFIPGGADITPSENMVWFYIMVWALYFKESKRVNAYYGNNAIPPKWFSKKTTLQENLSSGIQDNKV